MGAFTQTLTDQIRLFSYPSKWNLCVWGTDKWGQDIPSNLPVYTKMGATSNPILPTDVFSAGFRFLNNDTLTVLRTHGAEYLRDASKLYLTVFQAGTNDDYAVKSIYTTSSVSNTWALSAQSSTSWVHLT